MPSWVHHQPAAERCGLFLSAEEWQTEVPVRYVHKMSPRLKRILKMAAPLPFLYVPDKIKFNSSEAFDFPSRGGYAEIGKEAAR
jgi:hypothetical protein